MPPMNAWRVFEKGGQRLLVVGKAMASSSVFLALIVGCQPPGNTSLTHKSASTTATTNRR